MNRDEIFDRVVNTLAEMFQLDPAAITGDSRLAEDLDLDSIDAIDMAARMQELTGRRLEERELQGVRTVEDVVKMMHEAIETDSNVTG